MRNIRRANCGRRMTRPHVLAKLNRMRNVMPTSRSAPALLRLLALLASAMALQGCVAMAIPAIAGGVIANNEIRDNNGDDVDVGEGEQADELRTPIIVETSAETSAELARAAPIPQPSVPAATPAPGLGSDFEVVEGLTQLPAPDRAARPGRSELIYRSGFHELTAYTLTKTAQKGGEQSLPSALLANPSRLDGARLPCDFGDPAVLIDLDEKGRVFDPGALAATYDADSYGHLSRLRDAGVTIGWMSALTAEHAGAVRKALMVSGLDVKGEDALVLYRYPNDRKQTRREEFAAGHCLLAIAGDERADFDELYEYLVEPDAGVRLESLIGNGWFLLEEGLPAASE